MPIPAKKKTDGVTKQVCASALAWLKENGFDGAEVDVYRRAPGRSIRVRVVHKRFSRKLIADRARMTEGLLEDLPEEIDQEVSLILLLGPDELKKNLMNDEFNHPSPVVL